MKCVLCGGLTEEFEKDWRREYLKCLKCKLIFVPERFILPLNEEKRRYDLHENNPDDEGYRDFLSDAKRAVLKMFEKGEGLDFGSGPGPTLSVMLEEAGFKMDIYDKFYANDKSVFNKKYDFIVSTEVFEHLKNPYKEISRLNGILKPGGAIIVMTKMVDYVFDFIGWSYKNDDTHICFYSKKTFEWIADEFGFDVEFIGKGLIVLKKTMSSKSI